MKVAIIYNKDFGGVINIFGMQNKEVYSTKIVNKVFHALDKAGNNVAIVDGNKSVIEQIEEFMPSVVEGEKMGIVFNMAYGIQGESRYTHIPSLLEMLGVPYVGSSPSGHALALDKVYTKILLQKHGIPTPDFWVFNHENEDRSTVEYPSIVKPKMESVSYGLQVVYNDHDLKEAIKFIKEEFNQQVLVERFIPGREFCVGLLGNDPIEAFPVLEIDLEGDPDAIQSAEDKLKAPRQKICPAEISEELAEKMTEWSKETFRALQLRDFARVDIRMDEKGDIYILEINSMASLGLRGSYVHAAEKAGYSYDALVNKMLDVAAKRYFGDAYMEETPGLHPEISQDFLVKTKSCIRDWEDRMELLLKRMVNINSYVKNIEGVNEIQFIVKKELDALGFSSKTMKQVETGDITFFTNDPGEEYDILLVGHLDNDTMLSSHKYFSKSNIRLYGTGIWEQKGGLVMMIAALKALKRTRVLRKIRIGVLLTSDSSMKGRVAKGVIQDISSKAKYVIGLNGGSADGGIITSRSGTATYRFEMNLIDTEEAGNVSYAAGVFTSLLNKFTNLSDSENGLIISPIKVALNTNIMNPYAHGEATLSIRYSNQEQLDIVEEKIKKLIPKRKKETLYFSLKEGTRRPPMSCGDRCKETVGLVKDIARRIDIRLLEEHRWSSADICFVDQSIPVIDGIGPIGAKHPTETEYITKHSLFERSVLLAAVLYKLGYQVSK